MVNRFEFELDTTRPYQAWMDEVKPIWPRGRARPPRCDDARLVGPPDNRLDDMPMLPVGCGNCGARVLVRKSSWDQTSVQWNADATARCAERADMAKVSAHAGRGVFLVCSALRSSIMDAVRHGELSIVDEASCPT